MTSTRDRKDLQEKCLLEAYEVKQLLGEGTYGKVYKAACKRTKQTVALKQLGKSKVSLKDFKREVTYSRLLSTHPSIVTTYTEVFQTKSSWVFTQEISLFGDLLQFIAPGAGVGALPAHYVMCQITGALVFMHGKGLCHRDIKPENILLFDRKEWLVKLVDFGLTCKVGTLVRRVSVGYNTYTPPEVCGLAKGETYYAEKSSDVWQVGVALYCLLTGGFPWHQASSSSDRAYHSYLNWRKQSTAQPPAGWQRLSAHTLKILKKALNPVDKERCDIGIVNKHLQVHNMNIHQTTNHGWEEKESLI